MFNRANNIYAAAEQAVYYTRNRNLIDRYADARSYDGLICNFHFICFSIIFFARKKKDFPRHTYHTHFCTTYPLKILKQFFLATFHVNKFQFSKCIAMEIYCANFKYVFFEWGGGWWCERVGDEIHGSVSIMLPLHCNIAVTYILLVSLFYAHLANANNSNIYKKYIFNWNKHFSANTPHHTISIIYKMSRQNHNFH